MIKLKEILLLEKHLQDLFHATYPDRLYKILKDNKIKLTFVSATHSDEELNKGYPFYLSTMRQKYGSYARSGLESTGDISNNVIINLDGRKLTENGYKTFHIDYWAAIGGKDEQEERILSYKDEISPLNKYIKEIHVYIGFNKEEIKNKFIIKALIKINELAKKYNFPIYFYPPGKETAFKSQRPNMGGVTDIRKLNLKMPKWDKEDIEWFQFEKRYIDKKERSKK